jgi:hypothetical protein
MNAIGGRSGGALIMSQSAIGGTGGSATGSGAGGIAGNAVSTLDLTDVTAASLSATARAIGGAGGGSMGGLTTQGGNGNALAMLTSTIHAPQPLHAEADAYGGLGGYNSVTKQYALSGEAMAQAVVSSAGPSLNTTLAKASTLPAGIAPGTVTATASSKVQAVGSFSSNAVAASGLGGYPAGGTSAGFAAATAQPTGLAVPAGGPPGSTVLGSAAIGANYTTGISGTESVIDTISFDINTKTIPITGDLYLFVDNFLADGFSGSGAETNTLNTATNIETVSIAFTLSSSDPMAALTGSFELYDPPSGDTSGFNDVFASISPNGMSLSDQFFDLGAPMQVSVSSVPLPPALPMFASVLFGLAAWAGRRSRPATRLP